MAKRKPTSQGAGPVSPGGREQTRSSRPTPGGLVQRGHARTTIVDFVGAELTAAEQARVLLIAGRQDARCGICEQPFHSKLAAKPLFVDEDDGRIVGVLCGSCVPLIESHPRVSRYLARSRS